MHGTEMGVGYVMGFITGIIGKSKWHIMCSMLMVVLRF